MAAEQVTSDRNQQPEPQNKNENSEDIGQEIRERKTTAKQHERPPPS
jgi:hypothetical protein